jgi:pimeloyl-ACP methyl ester carboxylesterase
MPPDPQLPGAEMATDKETNGTRKTFVLVHGAWHGGWCWRRVADLLEQRGHKVFTPTLTGLGERSHLMRSDINLDTHIADVVNVFKWEDINDVVLVGHSYGGYPISGAIEHVFDRIASVVYLDAFVPEDGQKSLDTASDFARKGAMEAIAKGENSRQGPPAAAFHVNETDQAWVESKLTPQPIGVMLQPIRLTGARERLGKKSYIRAPKYPQPHFDAYYQAKKADPSWRTYEVPCGHDVMVDMPERLVEILLEVA